MLLNHKIHEQLVDMGHGQSNFILFFYTWTILILFFSTYCSPKDDLEFTIVRESIRNKLEVHLFSSIHGREAPVTYPMISML